MNPAAQIICLRQGDRPIKDYVTDFVELAHLTGMDKVCLMILFHGGLSEPLSSLMPLHDPHWTLEFYIDLALQLSCSEYTVGVVEEKHGTPAVSATPEPCPVMAAVPESRPIIAATPESPAVMVITPEPPTIKGATPESSAIIDATSVFPVVMNVSKEVIKVGPRHLRLSSSLEDTPLTSVRAAGISAVMSSPGFSEVVPLSYVLPFTAMAIVCVWATNCSATSPELVPVNEPDPEPTPVLESTPEPAPDYESAPASPEVAAYANMFLTPLCGLYPAPALRRSSALSFCAAMACRLRRALALRQRWAQACAPRSVHRGDGGLGTVSGVELASVHSTKAGKFARGPSSDDGALYVEFKLAS
ncbi:uncharacterized protein [Sinocyclocheilus grahami]|uniref:uncharacterized protein n=1 Tax=Sinocyclocheilus grahami TaxID=75366 RepID=UPI0007AD2E7D|nr:PREDICTED: uncharacterized protein LOC107582620 [Sinocyclocheilus grahami]